VPDHVVKFCRDLRQKRMHFPWDKDANWLRALSLTLMVYSLEEKEMTLVGWELLAVVEAASFTVTLGG